MVDRKMMMGLALAGVLSVATAPGAVAEPGPPRHGSGTEAGPVADQPKNPYEILRYCPLAKKIKGVKRVPLRRGKSSFGWYKILSKHHITNYAAVCTVTRYGNPKKTNGSQYRARVLARLRACKPDGTGCRTVKIIVVYQGFDLRKLADGSRFGIVTTYCKGYPGACPAWVTAALNTRPASTSKSATATYQWQTIR